MSPHRPNPAVGRDGPSPLRWATNPMYRYWLAAVILLSTAAQNLSAATHCNGSENVVFSCKIKGSKKVASLCATSRKVKNHVTPVALIYRFGKIGNIELEFPSSPSGSLERFKFDHYFRPDVDITSISFSNGSFDYDIHETINTEEGSPPDEQHTAGLSVYRKNKGVGLTCVVNSIEANWSIIDGAVPCEEDGGLPNSCKYVPQ